MVSKWCPVSPALVLRLHDSVETVVAWRRVGYLVHIALEVGRACAYQIFRNAWV